MPIISYRINNYWAFCSIFTLIFVHIPCGGAHSAAPAAGTCAGLEESGYDWLKLAGRLTNNQKH